MCTVIAKERSSRVSVLVGIPCCLSVEDVKPWLPKVTRENGWTELFVEEIRVGSRTWLSWLEGDAWEKAASTVKVQSKCRGKPVDYYDVSDRYQSFPEN